MKLLREPLALFFLLGGALYLLSSLMGEPGSNEGRIDITEAQVTFLAEAFGRTWQRPPTESELKSLVEEYVKEEVFYREALSMGLDRDDPVIRRRLRQKLEFLSEDISAQVVPTDEELEAFLAEQPERFRIEGRLSFQHIYFSVDRRGEETRANAAALLARLAADPALANDLESLGDRLPLPAAFESTSRTDIARQFGDSFADGVIALPPDAWAGPIESGFGLHLVRVTEREEDRTPELAEVRDAVVREWRVVQRARTDDAFYRQLREKYEVTVETPSWARPAEPGVQ